ncbi:MAG: alpha-ketoacid dehydrogenase subunit alpha/beta [Bacillota bacterium]
MSSAEAGAGGAAASAAAGAARHEEFAGLDRERLAGLLRTMWLIRKFELAVARGVEDGTLPGMAHLSVGHEAMAVGVMAALEPGDYVSSTHRAHGHSLAKGADPKGMMAEIYGRSTGLCRGKGGSLHVIDASKGLIGANGIVGAWNVLATGAGLSSKLLENGRVAVAFMGDDSTNIGFFHEAMNLAAVWDLPVVFVCENNGYGITTPQERHTKVKRIADRAAAYAMPAVTIDGNDVVAVYRSACEAVARARSGGGPSFIEGLVWRWRGHYEGDPDDYRTDEAKAIGQAGDPIAAYSRKLVSGRVLNEAEVAAVEAEAGQVIEEAVFAAEEAPYPDPGELGRDVFAPEPVGVFTDGSAGARETARVLAEAGGPATAGDRYVTMSAAIREALAQEMRRDPRVIVMGEDVAFGFFGVTSGLVDEFGRDRVRDTPISENAIVGAAVGAAMTGLRPVAELMFEDFITAGLDPIVNQAAKLRYMSGGQYRIPLVVRTPGGTGLAFAAQHSQSLEALFMHIPGLKVVVASSPYDAKGLLTTALRSDNPVLFFEHKLLYFTDGQVPEERYMIPFGVADVKRPGKDVTVLAVLGMVPLALMAAEELAAEDGLEIEVIDPRTLVPFDRETLLASVRKTGRLVVVEEGAVTGGVGAEVGAMFACGEGFGLLKKPMVRCAGLDIPIPFSKPLENLSVPNVERIKEAVRAAR